MSVAIDVMHYALPYGDLFGGVSAMTTEQFKKVAHNDLKDVYNMFNIEEIGLMVK